LTSLDIPLRFFPKDYFLIWLVLVLIGLGCRPLTPVDETRAVSVAWEMWQRGDFLVPYLNGEPYSHKPPLLQWCIHLSWWVLGVNEWSARLIAPLFALGNLSLTAMLARHLWPADETTPKLAPLILLAMPVWALWTSLTLYDMLITFFTLLGLLGILRAAHGESRIGFGLAVLGIVGGVLSKGPAILITILPPTLFAPWWISQKPTSWRAWYGLMLGAVLTGALLALAWAVPAGFAGGEAYRKAIFWGQSAGRISHSFAHQHPIWWYLALVPALFLPWTICPPLWRSLQTSRLDEGLRFCAIHGGFVLLVFSLISGKRIHYLLPIFPALALYAARCLSLARDHMSRFDQFPSGSLLIILALALLLIPLGEPHDIDHDVVEIARQAPLTIKLGLLGIGLGLLAWRPSNVLASVRIQILGLLGLMLCAHWVYRQVAWPASDMQAFASRLASVEKNGAPIAHWREYHGDFNFLGRLEKPLMEIKQKRALIDWMETHREAYVVLLRLPDPSITEEGADFVQFYRGQRRLMLWKASALLGRPDFLERAVRGSPD